MDTSTLNSPDHLEARRGPRVSARASRAGRYAAAKAPWPIRAIACLAMIGFADVGAVEAQRPRVTGFFGNMAYHAESGDVAGAEILIVFSLTNGGRTGQHYAYVQLAEGVPGVPQLVSVTVAGDSVSFALAAPYARISPFNGRVQGDSLIGRFQNGYELRLGRRGSYWR